MKASEHQRCYSRARLSVWVDVKVSHYLLVVLSAALASPLVVYHHATELSLVFAGLLPHDGSAEGGGAAGHGCCRRNKDETQISQEAEAKAQGRQIQSKVKSTNVKQRKCKTAFF